MSGQTVLNDAAAEVPAPSAHTVFTHMIKKSSGGRGTAQICESRQGLKKWENLNLIILLKEII